MTFSESVRTCLNKYATFSGRASRSEYWWFVLFYFILDIPAVIIDYILFGADINILSVIVGLALLLPSLAVGVRRFHDMDRTGWWLLIALTGIGGIVLIIWFCFRGTDGPNRFGPPVSGMATAPA